MWIQAQALNCDTHLLSPMALMPAQPLHQLTVCSRGMGTSQGGCFSTAKERQVLSRLYLYSLSNQPVSMFKLSHHTWFSQTFAVVPSGARALDRESSRRELKSKFYH